MRKLLLLLLIPLLSGTFVLQEEYQDKIEELENRIELLEQSQPLNITLEREQEGLSFTVVIENGYMIQATVCYEVCESVLADNQKFMYAKDYEQVKEEFNIMFEYYLDRTK